MWCVYGVRLQTCLAESAAAVCSGRVAHPRGLAAKTVAHAQSMLCLNSWRLHK